MIPNSKQKGLTLIEMTIALAILVLALLSGLVLATFGVVAGGESKMRVIATNLAQEGIEVVRNIRDSNWLAGRDWLENLPVPPSGSVDAYPKFVANVWTVEDTGTTFTPGSYPPPTDFRIGRDGNGLYIQPSVTNTTNFYRALNLQKISDNELKVTCYVAYFERGRWHLVQVEDHLFNWY